MNCGKWLCFQNTYSKYNYTFVKALDPVEKENRKKMVALIWVQFFRVKLTLVSFAAPPSCKKKHSRVLFGSSPLSLWFHPILSRFCSHQSPKNLWVLLGFDSPDWELVKMSSIRRRVMSGDCQALPYLPRDTFNPQTKGQKQQPAHQQALKYWPFAWKRTKTCPNWMRTLALPHSDRRISKDFLIFGIPII